MQILSIHLKNIKSHRDTTLNFSPGINVLSGPNGVGKSTVFEAIGYALFGVDAQSFVGKVERFVSIGAKRGEITVTFTVVDEQYQVRRTVGTPSKWLLAKEVGGEFEVEEHKDIKETESRLKELLGLDNGRSLAEQFELVIGPFQNEFLGPFVEKRPTTRRNKFDEILGIDSWRKTFSETNALQKAIKNKVEVLEGAIGPLKNQVALLPEKRVAHKTAKRDHETTAKELTDKQQRLQQLLEQLKALDDREQALRQLAVEVEKLAERIDNGHEKITRQKTLIAEAEKSRQLVVDNAAGKQAYEQAEQRLAGLREQQKQQRRLEQELSALTNQSSALTASIETETKGIAVARQELVTEREALKQKSAMLSVDETVQQRAERLPQLRDAGKQRRDQLGRLDGRRSGLEEGRDKLGEGVCPFFQEQCLNIAESPSADVFSFRLDELAGARSRVQEELLALERQEVEAVKAHEQIQALRVQRKAVEEQVGQLAARGKEQDRRESALASTQKELESLRQRLAAKQGELAAFASLAADIETAEIDVKRHQQARDLYVAHQGQAGKLEGLQGELVRFEAFLKQLQGELATKQDEQKTLVGHYDAGAHQSLRDEKDGLGRDVGSLEMKLKSLAQDITRLAAEIDALKTLEKEIAAKQAQIKAYGTRCRRRYRSAFVRRSVSGPIRSTALLPRWMKSWPGATTTRSCCAIWSTVSCASAPMISCPVARP